MQHFGGGLEALVLEQAVDQFLARIFLGRNFLECRIARQQHFRLDLDQRGRHVDEFGGQFDIHRQRLLHEVEVLRRDLRDGDVVNVDLLLADQVEQQVERPIVMFQVKIERRGHVLLGYQGALCGARITGSA